MKKLFIAALAALLLGCSSGSDSATGYDESNASVVTYRFDISNGGGEVEVKYTGLNTGADTSFIVVHSIDGDAYNTYYPTTFYNDSFIVVNDTVHIPSNTTDRVVLNEIDLVYLSDAGATVINSFQAYQHTLEAETTIVVNVENINNIEVENEIIIDTNSTLVTPTPAP